MLEESLWSKFERVRIQVWVAVNSPVEKTLAEGRHTYKNLEVDLPPVQDNNRAFRDEVSLVPIVLRCRMMHT